jgi:AraC-like DNA-binding protein
MLQVTTWKVPDGLRRHVAHVFRVSCEGPRAPTADSALFPDVGAADIAIVRGEPLRIAGLPESRAPRAGARVSAVAPWRAVFGARDTALCLRYPARFSLIGIQLPPACACVLGVRPAEIVGRVVSLDVVARRLDDAIDALGDALFGDTGAELLFRMLSENLVRRCERTLTFAASALAAQQTVEAIAAALGWSPRHLRRRFAQHVGRSPRDLARVARFARAWRIAGECAPANWAELAIAAGYCDQSHLIRDFRAFACVPPTSAFSAEWYAERRSPAF